MTRRIFPGLAIMMFFLFGCRQDDSGQTVIKGMKTDGEPQDNGGFLRLQLEGKRLRDHFLVAQFTPRGDLFSHDNLQFYNYDLDSEKYPRLLISVDHLESELAKWEGEVFPMTVCALTVEQGHKTLYGQGRIKITKVADGFIEAHFSGELVSEDGRKRFPIQGEVKGIFRLNV